MNKIDLLPQKLQDALTEDQLRILEEISFGSNHVQTQKIYEVAMQFYATNALDRSSQASIRISTALNIITFFGAIIAGTGILLQYIQFFSEL